MICIAPPTGWLRVAIMVILGPLELWLRFKNLFR